MQVSLGKVWEERNTYGERVWEPGLCPSPALLILVSDQDGAFPTTEPGRFCPRIFICGGQTGRAVLGL